MGFVFRITYHVYLHIMTKKYQIIVSCSNGFSQYIKVKKGQFLFIVYERFLFCFYKNVL